MNRRLRALPLLLLSFAFKEYTRPCLCTRARGREPRPSRNQKTGPCLSLPIAFALGAHEPWRYPPCAPGDVLTRLNTGFSLDSLS